MTASAIVIARRLAIQLLHEAQVAAPKAIDGVVLLTDGKPGRYMPRDQVSAEVSDQAPWAQVFSNPTAPAVPTADQLANKQLTLMISLDIKGVLELRAWQLDGAEAQEHTVSIRD